VSGCVAPALGKLLEMAESSPRWLLYSVTGLAVAVFVFCLWTGKVGIKGSRSVSKRAQDPVGYWARMSLLAAMIAYLLFASVR